MSKSPSLRRIQADIRELARDPSDRYYASPLEDDMFEWHFTIRGADGTDFEGGIYHGRILLPPEYPFKPPHIIFLTPSGRFETNVKVCLSFSAHHPELWQPAWGIRLILEAIISFLPTPADGAIGALDWSPDERKRLAKQSVGFSCAKCGLVKDLLPEIDPNKKCADASSSKFAKEIEQLHAHQRRNEAKNNHNNTNNNTASEHDEDANNGNEQTDTEAVPLTTAATTTAETTTASTDSKHNTNDDTTNTSTAPPPPTEEKQKEETKSTQSTEQATDPPQTNTATAPPTNTMTAATPSPNQQTQSTTTTTTTSVQPWISDPVVHAIIVTLAALVVLLYRKMLFLVQELKSLER